MDGRDVSAKLQGVRDTFKQNIPRLPAGLGTRVCPLDLGPQISSSDDERTTFDRSRALRYSTELYYVVAGLVKAMMGEKAASDY